MKDDIFMGSLENYEAQEGIYTLKIITKEFKTWNKKVLGDSSVRLLVTHAYSTWNFKYQRNTALLGLLMPVPLIMWDVGK